MNSQAKDLTKAAPRSPRLRLGGYALMARMIDKGRATLNGTNGEYHFNCPLDQSLLKFKDADAEAVKQLLAAGSSDDEVLAWFNRNGARKSPTEVSTWSDEQDKVTFHGHPEKSPWFDGECRRLGLDPEKATLHDMLEADDRASFR